MSTSTSVATAVTKVLGGLVVAGLVGVGTGLFTRGASSFRAMFSNDTDSAYLKASCAKADSCGHALTLASAGVFVLAGVAGLASGKLTLSK